MAITKLSVKAKMQKEKNKGMDSEINLLVQKLVEKFHIVEHVHFNSHMENTIYHDYPDKMNIWANAIIISLALVLGDAIQRLCESLPEDTRKLACHDYVRMANEILLTYLKKQQEKVPNDNP